MVVHKENFKRVNLKRKCFSRGHNRNFKRFRGMSKATRKMIEENVENQVAKEKEKEKDIFDFSESDDEDRANELGMGLELSDLPIFNGEDPDLDKQKSLVAITQDTVAPLFKCESEYDEQKLEDALVELKYSQFRTNQKEAIKRILMGRSTLFISPTGSGKSLCYQLPALLYWRIRHYITIVVSPLISLMEDQIRNVPSSLKAVAIHSSQTRPQRINAISQLVNGEAQVAFITPEAIVGGILQMNDLKNLPAIGFVCIDEAHCLSEWSHNFRPAYLQFLRILNEHLKIKTFLALTATATRATTFGIARSLVINPDTDVIGATKIPENLILSISCETNKTHALIRLLQTPTFVIMPSIIVYCSRREDTEFLASTIRTAMQKHSSMVEAPQRIKRNQKSSDEHSSPESSKPMMKLNWDAEAYHAGIYSQRKNDIQRRFIKGELRVVVATIAFGMGINKSNVRAIIHYDMPNSFESYVQEIGRAGRDGKPAQCHMFLRNDKADVFYQQRNIYSSVTEAANIEKLTRYIFATDKACRCSRLATQEAKEKLNKLNDSNPHQIRSWHKTHFTNTPLDQDNDDYDDPDDNLDDFSVIHDDTTARCSTDNLDTDQSKENKPVKYIHKSIVSKHRTCKSGHEIAFDIDEATGAINLFPETIITLLCQLEQAYPQLQIKQFSPIRSDCVLYCYKGSDQMKKLAQSVPAVREALYLYNRSKKSASSINNMLEEAPKKITFDLVQLGHRLQKSSNEVMRILKSTEWELNDNTGRYVRSQVRVSFRGNAFHINAIGDLRSEEMREINEFLIDYMRKQERIERNKVYKVYQTFMRHCISVEEMKDKVVRLQTSIKLKSALNAHFNPSAEQYAIDEANADKIVPLDENQVSESLQREIRDKASQFVTAHGHEFTSRAIAKIFQGVSCPNYPAEHWGKNRTWWRIFADVDFQQLNDIITKVLLKEKPLKTST